MMLAKRSNDGGCGRVRDRRGTKLCDSNRPDSRGCIGKSRRRRTRRRWSSRREEEDEELKMMIRRTKSW